jgi:hypothetical protein
MKVASVTVMAMTHGLARGRHVSWNESVAAAARGDRLLFAHGYRPRLTVAALGRFSVRKAPRLSRVMLSTE